MICDDLKVLFPKYASMSYCRDSLTIKEEGIKAKIREVVWTNSDFQNLEQLIVKDFTSFFQTAGAADLFYEMISCMHKVNKKRRIKFIRNSSYKSNIRLKLEGGKLCKKTAYFAK